MVVVLNSNPEIGIEDEAMNSLETTEFPIPDAVVGLVIGKGGECINRLQSESGCKIQIAPESLGPNTLRPCTITGSAEAIENAKQMITKVMSRDQGQGHHRPPGGPGAGPQGIEMMIKGSMVGLIIGKNGDQIKQLQEKAGVKMMMVQDNNSISHHDKPLRITGDPAKCQYARQLVLELIKSKDVEAGRGNGYGGPPHGHGGSGTEARFGGGGGRGHGSNGYGGDGDLIQTTYQVPADKCGLVIGRGGDTIRNINTTSKAKVELQRNPPPDPTVRVFNIRGTGEQVQRAVEMICDKAGLLPPGPHGLNSKAGSGGGGFDQFNSGGQPPYQAPQQDWNNQYSQWQQSGQSDPATSAAPAPGAGGGNQDFSAQWVEYYRKYGMHEYADAILAQTGGAAGAAPAGGTAPPGGAPGQQFGQPYQQQPYSQQPGYNQPGYAGQQNYGQFQQQNSW